MKTLGILGGGQLSWLLSLKARNLGLKVFVLSNCIQDPSAQNNSFWIQGDPSKINDLHRLFKKVERITFESELFSSSSIEKSVKSFKEHKIYINPSLRVMSLVQDRWSQKKLLSQYNLPTSDFFNLKLKFESQNQLLSLWNQWGSFVLKSRHGGYDGYGTFVVKSKEQIRNLKLPQKPFLVERFIPFQRELALLVARNKKGQIVFFPLVESFQEQSKCLWVKGPTEHKRLNALKKQICFFLNQILYEGLMAFELFDLGEDLMINELAPRVHNSGHYSLEALSEDQFTVHLKAISNRDLKEPELLSSGFAMYNLLGEGSSKPVFEKTTSSDSFYLNKKTTFSDQCVQCYWYGKKVNKVGRKMGHMSTISDSADHALKKLQQMRSCFKL